MNTLGNFIKCARKNVNLSQEKLAEKINVSKQTVQNWEYGKTSIEMKHIPDLSHYLMIPEAVIIKEIVRELDNNRKYNWPDFLFDEETNVIAKQLYLDSYQQELFGILYVYDAEYLQEKFLTTSTLREDLKIVPYDFVSKAGSINFINEASGLQKILEYVKPEFLLKYLMQHPDSKFDLCYLNKEWICDFIDNGYKPLSYMSDENYSVELEEKALHFPINMAVSKMVLPFLKEKELLISDSKKPYGLPDDFPKSLTCLCPCKGKPICFDNVICDKLGFDNQFNLNVVISTTDKPMRCMYKNRCAMNSIYIRDVMKIRIEKAEDQTEKVYLSITDLGIKLLDWLNGKE